MISAQLFLRENICGSYLTAGCLLFVFPLMPVQSWSGKCAMAQQYVALVSLSFQLHPVPLLVLSLSGPVVFSVASCPFSMLSQEASILTQKYWDYFSNFLDYIETSIPLAPIPGHTTKATFTAVGKYISLSGFQCDHFMRKRIPNLPQ